MKHKIIKFFSDNRIIDTHIGIWHFHIWLYFFATYFSCIYIFDVSIYFKQFCIFTLKLDFNKTNKPFDFRFKVFNIGFDTSRKYYKGSNESYERYRKCREVAFKEFKDKLTEKELEKAKEYCRLK